MTDDSNLLDVLVAQIDDENLRSRVAREIELLRGSRRFGLVFDRHLPESVRLPGHPVRKGVAVTLRDESQPAVAWRVTGFTDTSRKVAVLDSDGGERPVTDLVVIRGLRKDGIADKVVAATNKDLMEALFASEGMSC